MTANTETGAPCITCNETGKATAGWGGNPSLDGETCPDCKGTSIDQTPLGVGQDHCPHCGSDWKDDHLPGCVCAAHETPVYPSQTTYDSEARRAADADDGVLWADDH